jgi:hypothetical protein
MRVTKIRALIGLASLFLLGANQAHAADWFEGLSKKTPMVVNESSREIRLLAELKPSRFEPGWFTQLPGHHAVTWKGGKKSDEALFVTYVSDEDFYDAMRSLGAQPGNNLTTEAWTERDNPNSKAPKVKVKGDPVEILVYWKELESPVRLESALVDPSGKGIDMRFGGHKSFIEVWRSGCIACLQSCPGGKVSNHNYTLRDYAKDLATFKVNYSLVPKGHRRAVVIFRLKDA